jgi:hypothetical protein
MGMTGSTTQPGLHRTHRAGLIIGVAIVALVAACSWPSRVSKTSQLQGDPMNPEPTLTTQAKAQPAAAAPTATTASAPAAPVSPRVSEPIARALVEQMLSLIQDRRVGDDGVTHIGVSMLRNQSRATTAEFNNFCQRLANILTSASPDAKVQFTASAGAAVQYQLMGAAYLATFQGFDLWELFLSLSPADKDLAIWSAIGPVHVLRQPRVGEPQFVRIVRPN